MRPSSQTRRRPASLFAEQRWLIGLFVVVVASQCLLWAGAVFLMNAARAYVAGEARWSTAQKSAVRHLLRYTADRDASALAEYQREIAVPLADRRAREALLGAHRDEAAARAALIEGRNHPEDVGAMVALVLHFRWLPELAHAIDVWERADAAIEELDAIARALRDSAGRGPVAASAAAIRRVDAQLTALEEEFSATLGLAARRVARVALVGASAATAAILALAALLASRLLREQRRAEVQSRKLVEHAADVFNIFDPAGRYRYSSPAVERLLGWTQEDLQGRTALELVHPDDRADVASRLAVAVSNPNRPERVELRFRCKDGSYRNFESIGTSHVFDGEIEVVVVSRDVTERRALEQELLRAQKMESIGRLAGGIAHDFNNVLTALMGHAEQARSDPSNTALVRAELDEILSSAERAARLTRQLLAFARRQVIAPEVIDLGRLVLNLREMLRRLLGDAITLAIRIDPALGAVRADPGQIEQVLVNLVVNARDAMPEGGRVSIEATHRTLDAASQVGALPAGAYVVLSVADTGAGIDPETAAHLFEPFYTTKDGGKGTGLGLATCYGIVTQAGGDICVTSDPARGTRFDVLLPRVFEAPSGEGGAARREAPRGAETILVVEDEPRVRRVTVRSLRSLGYRVLEAADGEDALAVLAREGDVALVVSDVVMPRLGGPALAERIAQRWPQVGVLLVSGYSEDARLRAPAAAPVRFLEKPFGREELARAVRVALDA
jgi:PAS domain S-box-containing protein